MDADAADHREIRAAGTPRRQQGRRRHPGALCAAPAPASEMALRRGGRGRRRARGRRRHHPGHHRDVGRGGAERGGSRGASDACGGRNHPVDIRDAAGRHEPHWPLLRTFHARMVPHAWRARGVRPGPASGHSQGVQPLVGGEAAHQLSRVVSHPRSRVSVHHRRRSAVQRPRPLRAPQHHSELALCKGHAHTQLPRPGRVADSPWPRPRDSRQPLLRAHAPLVHARGRGDVDGRRHHRQPGSAQRFVHHILGGHQPGFLAQSEHQIPRHRERPALHPRRQLGPARGLPADGGDIRAAWRRPTAWP